MARARPWIAARCVLAALGHPEHPDEGAAYRLAGARILAEGALAVSEFVKAMGEAGKR